MAFCFLELCIFENKMKQNQTLSPNTIGQIISQLDDPNNFSVDSEVEGAIMGQVVEDNGSHKTHLAKLISYKAKVVVLKNEEQFKSEEGEEDKHEWKIISWNVIS